MKNFCIVIVFFLFACKKEKKDETFLPPASERFKILTAHQWTMSHEYIDSTAYAKSHLNEWPLTTTDDFMDMYDTCSLESENLFLVNGQWKLNKSKTCSAAISDDAGRWKLTNNDNDFVIVGQDTLHIVELNNQRFKMYYEQYTYFQGKVILIEYCMWTFDSK